MASLIYTSALEDLSRGAIDFDTDTVRVMLVSSSYTENKDTHTKRSDVTNEITGTGYTAGGNTSSVTITKNTTADTVTVSFGPVEWTTSTITARKAVYYKSRGGAASADELIAVNDFGSDRSSSGGTFRIEASTITFQN